MELETTKSFCGPQDAGVSFVYDRCPVCERVGKSLACSRCLNEDRTSFLVLTEGKVKKSENQLARTMFLNKTVQENLQQTQAILSSHQQDKARISSELLQITKRKVLDSAIAQCQHNVTRLMSLLKARKLETQKLQHSIAEERRLLASSQKRLYRVLSKKSKMKEYISNKQIQILSTRSKLEPLTKRLKQKQIDHVKMLVEYIFPINEMKEENKLDVVGEEVSKEESLLSDKDATSLQEELEEARRMSFVHGRWVDQQAGGSDVVKISVGTEEARAPSDGNYGAYQNWLESNCKQTGSDPPGVSPSPPSPSESPTVHHRAQNPAMAVSAALSHTAQLLQVTRKLLSIHLPHQLHYRTFCKASIAPQVFNNTVKLLSSNILALCVQEGVDGFTLHPLHSLRNLQVLFAKLQKDGVRTFPVVPSLDLVIYMEESLLLGDISDDELDDSDDTMEYSLVGDWEEVTSMDAAVTGSREVTSSPAYTSTNAQSSVMQQPSGLVTSALAWAKGFGFWGQNE